MPRPRHQDDREGADRHLAREAEKYRDRVSKGKEPAQQEGLIKEMRKPKRKNLSETDGGLLTPAAVGMPAAAWTWGRDAVLVFARVTAVRTGARREALA